MNIVEIPEINKSCRYPSEWGEMTKEQILFVMKQALFLVTGQIQLMDFKVKVLYYLMGIKRTEKHNKKDAKYLTEEQREQKYDNIARLLPTIDFMFTEHEGKPVFNYDCVKNLVPQIKVPGIGKIYGPAEALLNCTFGEYMAAFEYFRLFREEREEVYINNLCSVLYRPWIKGYKKLLKDPNYKGEIREPFNRELSGRRSDKFNSVPAHVKYAIFIFFGACDNYIKSAELIVDGKTINLGELFKSEGNDDAKNDELGLTAIMYNIADSGTFGPIEGVNEANLYDILLKMYCAKKESDKLKKSLDGINTGI